MNSLELIDQREQLKVQAEEIIAGAEREQRKLTDEEQARYESLKGGMDRLNGEIRKLSEGIDKQNKKETTMNDFSLIKAIRSVADKQDFDEVAASVIRAGVEEMRKTGLSFGGQIQLPVEHRDTVQATVDEQGKEIVATDKLDILEPLRANLVMAEAGATFLTGLVGNVSIPTYDGTTVGWAGEVDAAADGAGKFGSVELSPKRLTAYMDISKQFLLQDSVSAEAMLRNDIVKAISNELEATILGDEEGSNTKPEGIFNGADSATLDYDGTVDMEEMLDEANVSGNYHYIVSPSAKATLRKAPKGDHAFVLEDGEINGIPVLCTSAAKGALLGNFEDYVIAQWGAIDLTVDPYTQAVNGMVRLVVNAYFDAKPRRAKSFVAVKEA